MNKVNVLDIPLYRYSLENLVEHINHILSSDRLNLCISATGAHGMIYAKRDYVFKDILQSFYLNLPDGMPSVWVGRLKGASEMQRCCGPDVFAELMLNTVETNVKHYLCGGTEGVANKLKNVCVEKFNNRNIVGTFCPPFLKVDEYDYKSIGDSINESGADIVWVGISTPKQEQFALKLSKYTNVHLLFTVGAAFDFHIGNVRKAPKILQNLGLEWFFRLIVEPKRLWRRYIEIVPLFAFFGIKEIIYHKLNK